MTPLIDTHKRQIRYMRISITDRCNFRCRYCMPSGGIEWLPHEEIMRYEEYLRILKISIPRGVEKVRITGGEPLVRKGLAEFIEAVKGIDGLKELSLTTNGFLLPLHAADLKRAGLDRVNISLDTLDRDKFSYITRVNAFDQVMEGIMTALEYEFSPVKINVVAIRGFNDDEINAFAALTVNSPVEVRFIELMPMGCASRYADREIISSNEIMRIIEDRHGTMIPVEYTQGPARVFRIEGSRGKIGIIGAMSEHSFCSTCNRIRITAEGSLRPCLFCDDHIDLLTPMRQGISEAELEKLIEEGVMLKQRSHGMCIGQHIIPNQGCSALMNTIGG
ncbi:MAG TPA: GTP 3',8-cyclase MoaA [Deltaproteobacteria bacterium]|nr:GTP 3',8-cyclase MoaA [Deltaproteobacteria bacterium]